MTSSPSTDPSARCADIIEDMTVRGFSEQTRQHYVRRVRSFAGFIRRSPDTAAEEDVYIASSCTSGRPECSRRA
jgi:integrase/recombinase XerD